MKTSLRLLSLLLACLLTVAALASCDLSEVLDGLDDLDNTTSEETAIPDDTYLADTELGTAPSVGVPDVEIETSPDFPFEDALDALDTINWGGEDFTVLCGGSMKQEMMATEITGALLNDAVYERNALLGELCNLRWKTLEIATDQGITTAIQNEVMVAAGDFQLIDHYASYAVSHASQGYLDSFGDLGRETLQGPWWDQATANFFLNGQIYFLSGSANTLDDDATYVLFLNEKLLKEVTDENPDLYQTVLDGDWTLDRFRSLVQSIHVDNGNGKWDEMDRYGFATYYGFTTAFLIGSDLRYVDISSQDKGFALPIYSRMEQAIAACDILRSFYTPSSGTFSAEQGKYEQATAIFKRGDCLFYGDVIGSRTATEEEYGILPLPKFNEEQTEYRSWAHVSASALSVPTTVGDKAETVGGILEALAILSHKTVRPAYLKSVLKERAPATKVLELVLDSRVCDLAFFVSEASTTAVFEDAVGGQDLADRVSRWNRIERARLEKLMGKFEMLHS